MKTCSYYLVLYFKYTESNTGGTPMAKSQRHTQGIAPRTKYLSALRHEVQESPSCSLQTFYATYATYHHEVKHHHALGETRPSDKKPATAPSGRTTMIYSVRHVRKTGAAEGVSFRLEQRVLVQATVDWMPWWTGKNQAHATADKSGFEI